MGDYRASAWDLNTNNKITDLTAGNLEYTVRINDAGDCSLGLNLGDQWVRQQAAAVLAYGDNPWKLVVTANADQDLLTAGLMMNPKRGSSSTDLTVAGAGMTSYFDQLVLTKDYNTSISPAQLAVNVVTDLQNQTGANIGIGTALKLATTPANITPTYKKSSFVTGAQVLSDVTAAVVAGTGGVDFSMVHSWNNGAPAHTFTVWTPRAGVSQANGSGLVVDLGVAIEWDWPVSNKQVGNQVFVVGGGSGNVQPVATGTSSAPIGGQGQAPLLQQVLNYNHIENQAQLQNIANGAAQMWGSPIATPTVKFPANYPPCQLGSFNIGDDVRIMCEPNMWFPAGKDEWWRIVQYKVNLTDPVPWVELTLNRPPIF